MSSLFIFFLWVGGLPPVWNLARRRGHGKIASAFASFTWPVELGAQLAKKYCKEPLE